MGDQRLTIHDGLLAASLMAFVLARINLKDFRDRTGDALYGRPTFLLRFGRSEERRVGKECRL